MIREQLAIILVMIAIGTSVTVGFALTEPNPYCDKVSDAYMKHGGICHDRYDISESTGLATCNDGSHRPDPENCPDASTR